VRTTVAVVAVALVLAGGAIAVAGMSGSAADGGRALAPRLALTRAGPITIHGVGFHRRERVRLDLRRGGVEDVRHVRARHGRFTVVFAGATDRCMGLVVVATGRSGTRARLHQRPRPQCPPA
jgi:hypothetical protein